jgi:hypothetical protein
MAKFTLPEQLKVVSGCATTTTSNALTCDYISLKNAQRVWIVANMLQAASHATAMSIMEATDVTPTGATAVTATFPSWKCADVATSDVLVRTTTDAANVACTAGTTNQILIMEIDPAKLTEGYDCIAAIFTASSEATNFATVTYYIEPRYIEDSSPTAITD